MKCVSRTPFTDRCKFDVTKLGRFSRDHCTGIPPLPQEKARPSEGEFPSAELRRKFLSSRIARWNCRVGDRAARVGGGFLETDIGFKRKLKGSFSIVRRTLSVPSEAVWRSGTVEVSDRRLFQYEDTLDNNVGNNAHSDVCPNICLCVCVSLAALGTQCVFTNC